MPHWKALGPDPRYLAAYQLNGKDVTVEIESFKSEVVARTDGQKDKCRVLRFKGKELPFICNQTNGTTIAKAYGNDIDGWVGKVITLYPATIVDKRTKEVMDCIRVKIPAQQKTLTPKTTNEKEVPNE